MIKQVISRIAIGAALLAMATPAAFAQTGCDPEPTVVRTILHFLGLA